jgi:hypothetical protein
MADSVTGSSGGSSVQATNPHPLLARHTVRDASRSTAPHEIVPMIRLVSAQRPDPPAQVELWMSLDLFQRHPGPRLGNRIVNPKVGT